METKHTPKPWQIVADGVRVGPPDGFIPFGGCGCCGSPWLNGTKEEQEANAYLMLAAPDLLEALKGLLNGLDANHKRLGIEAPFGQPIDAARAAIAKAEGRS